MIGKICQCGHSSAHHFATYKEVHFRCDVGGCGCLKFEEQLIKNNLSYSLAKIEEIEERQGAIDAILSSANAKRRARQFCRRCDHERELHRAQADGLPWSCTKVTPHNQECICPSFVE